ncbi:MAG: hypothetical protein V7K24_10890 [Nostoc sp.]
MGHGALGIGHGALGMGHWAWGIGYSLCPLIPLSPCPHSLAPTLVTIP